MQLFSPGHYFTDFVKQEEMNELKATKRDEYISRLERLLEALNDSKNYAITHPHFKEIPVADIENTQALMD